jgi:hypothetical protein
VQRFAKSTAPKNINFHWVILKAALVVHKNPLWGQLK